MEGFLGEATDKNMAWVGDTIKMVICTLRVMMGLKRRVEDVQKCDGVLSVFMFGT